MLDNLNELNATIYAAKNYDNPGADTEEFLQDVTRIRTLKKLFTKYRDSGEINTRLTVNHLIVLYNVFGADAGTRLLFLKLKDYIPQVSAFLFVLGYLPERVENIGTPNKSYKTKDIDLDQHIIDELGKIL